MRKHRHWLPWAGFAFALLPSCLSDPPSSNINSRDQGAAGQQQAPQCRPDQYFDTTSWMCMSAEDFLGTCWTSSTQCAEGECRPTVEGRLCTKSCSTDSECGGTARCVQAVCVKSCEYAHLENGWTCIDGRPTNCAENETWRTHCESCGCQADMICIQDQCVGGIVATTIGKLFNFRVLDDGYVYLTEMTRTEDLSKFEWTLKRVPLAGGEPEPLVTQSPRSLQMVAYDESAYYYNIFDYTGQNDATWKPHLMRLSKTLDQAPQEMVSSFDPNDLFFLVGQTPQYLYVYRSSTFMRLNKPDPQGHASWHTSLTDWPRDTWMDGDILHFAAFSFTKAQAYHIAPGRPLVKDLDIPAVCSHFLHEPSTGGWIGICGKDSRVEITRIDRSGTRHTIAADVVPFWPKAAALYGNQLYWSYVTDHTQEYYVQTFDIVTQQQRRLTIPKESRDLSFDENNLYYIENDTKLIRLPLSAASPL